MAKDLMLLTESPIAAFEIDLNESNVEKGLLKFRGKFQQAEETNKNNRRYPFEVLNENVQRIMSVVKSRGLLGELDHPNDSIIHFKEASHIITGLKWNGMVLEGSGEVLNTAHGRQLKALLNDGVRVGISSRGVGSGKVDESGVLVIGENYRLITFDAVADPSCHEAFQEKYVGTKRESVIEQPILTNYHDLSNKNNNSSIHKLSKESVIAAMRGVFKQETNKIKERLS